MQVMGSSLQIHDQHESACCQWMAVLEKIASKQHQPWCQGEEKLEKAAPNLTFGDTVCSTTNLEFGGVLVLTET